MRELLGGKGANLAEMTSLKIPVPQGFIITTEACAEYYKSGKKCPPSLKVQIEKNLKRLERITGKKLGDKKKPLLLSVRSGAAVSMPGMMDTVLNLGLNDEIVKRLAEKTKNERFAYDTYRRFIQMFGNVVLGIKHDEFERKLEDLKEEKHVEHDTGITADDFKRLIEVYKTVIKKETKKAFPADAKKQLIMAIEAVFQSWNNQRAIVYRKINNITGLLGTAVNIQTMVFGNTGPDSGTGVCFTRNPSTGENHFYGEYLMNAQGEDVVAGLRTPHHINKLKEQNRKIFNQLYKIAKRLEKHYKDMQDVEFTVEENKLYILQTRNGKRTVHAAIKIAVDLVKEKLIKKKDALLRINPLELSKIIHNQIDPVAKKHATLIAKGLPASPGAAIGKVAFTAEQAVSMNKMGNPVVLVRKETSPEDIQGMDISEGILTAKGGMTSHAAIVARSMGKCCIVGCNDITVNEQKKQFFVGQYLVKEGDYISLDGTEGDVILGKVALTEPQLKSEFKTLMSWADEVKKLKIRVNADTPHECDVAKNFGVEGIGLVRTEHMFFEEERIVAMREMVFAINDFGRILALKKLLPMQKEDFKRIFTIMDGLPVTVRLLDPPLHEFLPKTEKELKDLAREMKMDFKILQIELEKFKEANPMLGNRGVRLGINYPEIYELQVRAILSAASEVSKKGIKVLPEIEVPLVEDINELREIKSLICQVAKELEVKIKYKVGTMVELPRACIIADELAKEADFLSFGTNDLTQTTLGFSRDDVMRFIPLYIEKNILKHDPFVVLDQKGVGTLMRICVEKARSTNKSIEIGICGEHGGEASSVEFCHNINLDYVSCSPYRIPIARLAAAQAALKQRSKI